MYTNSVEKVVELDKGLSLSNKLKTSKKDVNNSFKFSEYLKNAISNVNVSGNMSKNTLDLINVNDISFNNIEIKEYNSNEDYSKDDTLFNENFSSNDFNESVYNEDNGIQNEIKDDFQTEETFRSENTEMKKDEVIEEKQEVKELETRSENEKVNENQEKLEEKVEEVVNTFENELTQSIEAANTISDDKLREDIVGKLKKVKNLLDGIKARMKDSVEKGPEKIKENLDDLKKVMNLEKKMLDNIDEKLINNPSDKKTKSIFDKKLVKLLDNLNGKIEEIKTNLDEKKVDVKELISKAKKAQVKQIIQEDSNQIENKEEVSSNKSNQTEAVNSKKSNHNFEIIKKDAQEVKEIVSNKLKDVLKDKVSSENIEKVSEKISKNEELANLSSEEIEKVVDKAAKKVDKNKNLFGKYKSVDKIALNKVANEVNEQMKMSDFSSKQDAQNSDLKFSSKQINLKVVEGAADKTSTEDSKFSDLLKGDKLKSEIAKPKANVKHVQRNIVEEFKEKNKLIIKQISNYTKAVKLKNGSMMRMVLNPEKLGKVGLHVTIKEGNVTVKFNAQNEQVKQAIEQNFSQLKDNFQKQGLTVNKIEVNVSTDDGNFESKSDAQNFQGKDSEKGFGSKKGNSQNKGFKFMNSEFESKPVSSMDVGEEDNLNIQA